MCKKSLVITHGYLCSYHLAEKNGTLTSAIAAIFLPVPCLTSEAPTILAFILIILFLFFIV